MAICRFCSVSADDAWAFTEHAVALPCALSSTPGHCLAPRRHVGLFYELDAQEYRAVWDLVGQNAEAYRGGSEGGPIPHRFADFPVQRLRATLMFTLFPSGPGENTDLPTGDEWIAGLDEDSR